MPTYVQVSDADTDPLNVRSEPVSDSSVVGQVEPGVVLEYTDEDEGWYEIILPGGEVGWVLGDFVEEYDAAYDE